MSKYINTELQAKIEKEWEKRKSNLINNAYNNPKVMHPASVLKMISCEHNEESWDLYYNQCTKCGAIRRSYCHSSPPCWFDPTSGMDVE